MIRTIIYFLLLFILTSCTNHEIERKAYNLPDKAAYELREVFRIEEPAPGSFFINNPKVHFLEGGNLVVQNYPDHKLYELTIEGEFVQTIGREGRGPGEFQETNKSFWVRGDSIHVFDPNHGRHQLLKKDSDGIWEWQRERPFFFVPNYKMRKELPDRIYKNKEGILYGKYEIHPGTSEIDTLTKSYYYIARIDHNLDQISENSRMRPGWDVAIVRNQGRAMNASSSQFARGFYNFDPNKNLVVYVRNTSNEIIIIDSNGNEKVSGYLPFQQYPYENGNSSRNSFPPDLKKVFNSKLLKHEAYYQNVILHEGQLWLNLAREDTTKPNWVITTLAGEVLKSFRGPDYIVNARIHNGNMYGGIKDEKGANNLVKYELIEMDE